MKSGQSIFIIARIRLLGHTSDQRTSVCVAAFHDDNLKGADSVMVVRQILDAARVPENAAAIRTELAVIGNKYHHLMAGKRVMGEKWPPRPCSFISTLLAVAVGCPTETRGYIGSGEFLSVDADCTHSYEGIAIIDVTEPSTPAYAFVIPSKGLLSAAPSDRDPPPKNAPLSAFDYCREYEYSINNISTQQLEELAAAPPENNAKKPTPEMAVARLHHERIVDAGQISETWPRYFVRRRSVVSGLMVPVDSPTLTALHGVEAASDRPPRILPSFQIPDHIHQSVNKAIFDSDARDLLEIEWSPELSESVQAVIARLPTVPDNALPLLVQSFRASGEVIRLLDLSPYALHSRQATIMIKAFSSTLESLNISCNSWVGRLAIRSLAVVAPKLTRLVILGCDGVKTSELDSMQQDGVFKKYEAIHHSALQLRSLDLPQVGSAEFSAVIRVRSWNNNMADMRGVSLRTMSRFTVLQGPYDLLRHFTAPTPAQLAIVNSNIFLSACFARYRSLSPATSKALPISSLVGEYFNGNITDGWIFVLDAVTTPGPKWFDAHWTFLRVNEGSYEAHSLRSFVEKLDGPVDSDMVDELQEILTGTRYRMMQEATAETFMCFLDESYVPRSKAIKRRRVL